MATATVEQFSPNPRYATLRTHTTADGSVHWCHMHADLVQRAGRACFKPALVAEILQYQHVLGARLQIEAHHHGDALHHVVLASDCDAFNLGGDLE